MITRNKILRTLVVPMMSLVAAAAAASLDVPSASGPLTIDGAPDEAFWQQARTLPLEAAGFGAPFPAGGEARVAVRGGYLCLSARVPEPERVSALSLGRNPAWSREDLVSWTFRLQVKASNRALTLSVNPLGAYRFDFTPPEEEAFRGVIAAAKRGAGGWAVEAAIPLDGFARIGFLSVERVRAPRPNAPELRWSWPALHERADFELAAAEPSGAPGFEPTPPPRRVSAAEAASGGPLRVPGRVFTDEERKQLGIDRMMEQSIRKRMSATADSERREWEKVKTQADWERFRDPRLAALKNSLGAFPERTPLRAAVTRRADYSDGFILENVIFESRPGLLVAANLYLPSKIAGRIPAIVVVHSHHAPKTQSELQDMGMTWARAGVAVLVMDQPGAGERLQSQPWSRESYYSRYAMGMQLYLAGESLIKWMAWDLMRGIDLLLERPYIDGKRIVMLGAVAGGGDPAAVTAVLDPRIAAVLPFNFGEAGPEEHYTSGPRRYDFQTASPGGGGWESTRSLRRGARDQFFPWFVCASGAPRPFVYSFEIGWPEDVEHEPMWARYKKVYELYGKRDRLAEVHGFGPFPGPGECTNVGTFLRKRIYPILKQWLDIPVPPQEYHNPRPEAELMCLTPAIAAERRPKTVSALAAEMARGRLAAARAKGGDLRARLQAKLGDIEPDRNAPARAVWTKTVEGLQVEGVAIESEPGITVPSLIIKPDASATDRLPVVLALAQGGKERFLQERGSELAALAAARVAVCLADVRGVGETARDTGRGPNTMSLSGTELALGNTLLGARLKDARTVFAYLARRADFDPKRIVLWGDSFAAVNPRDMVLDRSLNQAAGPQIQEQAEPMGALVALLTALYENDAAAVAARRGLASYLSVLKDRFCYLPHDVIVPGILEAGDIGDVVEALSARAVLLEAFVNGRNEALTESELKAELGAPPNARLALRGDSAKSEAAAWIAAACRR